MLTNLELFEHFRYLDWLIHKFNFYKYKSKNKMDVSRGQGRILGTLFIEDSISTKDLSKRTGINVSSLNEILSKLEKKELIKRVPYEKDKRIIINCLTDKARENQPQLDLSFFNCLNSNEKNSFNNMLDRLCNQIEMDIYKFENKELINNCINRRNSFELFLDYQENKLRD